MSPLDLTKLGLDLIDLRKTGVSNPLRKKPVGGIVLHSPGVTYVNRVASALGHQVDDVALDHAVASDFDGRKYQPGYIVGQGGSVYMLEDDTRTTSHSSQLLPILSSGNWRSWAQPLGGELEQHGRGPHVVYDWWDAVYSPTSSPGDLPFDACPNRYIGIDLRPRYEGGVQFSEVQIGALVALVVALSREHRFLLDIRHVLTHSLADPIRRGTVARKGVTIGVHWDPPAKHFDYAAFMVRLTEAA